MNIVFMGTPEIAASILLSISEQNYKPVAVITQPDKEKNRGKKVLPSPVKEAALSLGLPVMQPERVKGNTEFFDELKKLSPDLILVVAYGKILPKEILELPRLGCINVHASLLPKLRGASPIQHAILEGEKVTGVTLMQMDEGMDTGQMIAKAEMEIGQMNADELSHALAKLGGDILVEWLPKIEKGEICPEPQDDNLATYAGLIKKEDGNIDFKTMGAEEILRMTSAYEPWPGVRCKYNGEPLKICKASAVSIEDGIKVTGEAGEPLPGRVIKTEESGIYVETVNGILVIEELQLPGKNRVKSGDFLRGHKMDNCILESM